MKSIDINKKQKEMLLEMSKVLFPEPEFSFWWEYEMYGRGLKQDFNDVLCVSETLNPPINVGTEEKPYFRTSNYFNIHWFEFCWTLLNKILESNLSPIKSCEIIKEFGLICFNKFESLHPVNYLYERFKKLEL